VELFDGSARLFGIDKWGVRGVREGSRTWLRVLQGYTPVETDLETFVMHGVGHRKNLRSTKDSLPEREPWEESEWNFTD
jgi:hypothetical protein